MIHCIGCVIVGVTLGIVLTLITAIVIALR